MTLSLHRHWTADARPRSLAEQAAAARTEVAVGHPPVPPVALPHLHRHLDGRDPQPGAVLWHHRRGQPWEAVCDLHRAGDHMAAAGLAELILWTERHGTVGSHTVWEIRDQDATAP